MKITFASALLLLAFTSISHAAPVGNGAAIGASASAPGSNANDVASGVPVDQVTGTANQITDNTGNNKATDTGNKVAETGDKVTAGAKGITGDEGTAVSVKAAGVKLSVEHRSLKEVETTVDGATSSLGIAVNSGSGSKGNDLTKRVTNTKSTDTVGKVKGCKRFIDSDSLIFIIWKGSHTKTGAYTKPVLKKTLGVFITENNDSERNFVKGSCRKRLYDSSKKMLFVQPPVKTPITIKKEEKE
ncbi:1740_t:CDS:2 [Ambispora gerdemannii]|uniref:1740_t:CDS:1 n=1 Tax=Ambispora gerdemannii TaxID=144530 RepID=A0A9N9CFK3_9GLOM|nr:1740_t:CDS:2 [Ambispora gerdemannii]